MNKEIMAVVLKLRGTKRRGKMSYKALTRMVRNIKVVTDGDLIGHKEDAIERHMNKDWSSFEPRSVEATVKWFNQQTWTLYEGVATERNAERRTFGVGYADKLPLFWVAGHGIYSHVSKQAVIAECIFQLKDGVDFKSPEGYEILATPTHSYAYHTIVSRLGQQIANDWFNPLMLGVTDGR